MYSCICTYLPQLHPEDLGFRGCVRQQHASALRLCYSMLCRQRKESSSNDELLPVILLSLTAGTILEWGVELRLPLGGCESPWLGAAVQLHPIFQVHRETQQPWSVRGKYQPQLTLLLVPE